MPTYEYRCPGCGILERSHRIGTAPRAEHCFACGTAATRVLSSPALHRGNPRSGAISQAERSKHDPELARRADSDRSQHRAVNPAVQRLVGRENAQALRELPPQASRHGQH